MSTFVSSAAEVQPIRSDTPIPPSDMSKRKYVAHPQVPPSSPVEVAPSSTIVAARHQLPATMPMSRRQSKSSVPIGINEPVLGSMRAVSYTHLTLPTIYSV